MCLGVGSVSIAEGRIDVLIGAISGLVFILYYDDIFNPLMGESLGNQILPEFFKANEELSVLILGGVATLIAILVPKIELEDEEENRRLENKRA